jgi:hypothetical protein
MGAGDDVTLFRDLGNLGSGGASGTVGRRKSEPAQCEAEAGGHPGAIG